MRNVGFQDGYIATYDGINIKIHTPFTFFGNCVAIYFCISVILVSFYIFLVSFPYKQCSRLYSTP